MMLLLFASGCFASETAPAKFFLAEENIVAYSAGDFSRNIDHRQLYDRVAEHFEKELGLQLVVTDEMRKHFLNNGCMIFSGSGHERIKDQLLRACRKENIKYIVYYACRLTMERALRRPRYPGCAFPNVFSSVFLLRVMDTDSGKYIFVAVGRDKSMETGVSGQNAKYQRDFFTDLGMKALADCLANGKWQELKKLL